MLLGSDDKLYNLTLDGMIDLGFNEVSASTGANDTWTTIDIAAYPDGSTKTQLHYDSGAGGEVH